MEITDVKIRKMFDDEPLKAVVSMTLDNEIAIHDVKIIYAKEKLFVVMPSKKNADGSFRDIVHPINADFRHKMETILINEYKREMENAAERTVVES
jgi:Uncharacterized protein, involved in the regulation of septum location